MAVIGYTIDRHYQHTAPVATAIGTMIGFSAGLYRFIRQALAVSRNSAARDADRYPDRSPTDGVSADQSSDPTDDDDADAADG